MSYVVFLFYGATNLRQDRAKSQVYDVKNKTFINFTFVKGRTLVISNITILHPYNGTNFRGDFNSCSVHIL